MARELIVAWCGRRQRREWDELCGRYRRRIRRQMPVRDRFVKSRGGDAERRRREGEALLAAVPEGSWIVAVDRLGTMRTSEELAAWLAALRGRWSQPIALLVGSDVGLDGGVLAAARETMSLGPMTLPHELARLVLYEQLYRALSIAAGIKYHRAPLSTCSGGSGRKER